MRLWENGDFLGLGATEQPDEVVGGRDLVLHHRFSRGGCGSGSS